MRGRRSTHLAAAALLAAAAFALAWDLVAPPRRDAVPVLADGALIVLAAVALFGLVGLGVALALLPAGLRARAWLWVLPAGACATGLALTVLGFAGVPFAAATALVAALGAAGSIVAVWLRGIPPPPGREGWWVAWLALLVGAVALVPVLSAHLTAVVGLGSDAHMAAGTAEFLRHAAPTGEDTSLPVDRMPVLWRSKYPIYYAFAAVTEVSGHATWQVLPVLQALLVALGAIGLYLLARETLRAPAVVALAVLAIAGASRMVMHTALNPYVNQLWGWMALPFALVLAAHVARAPSRGAVGLLALVVATLAFAYPLALPIALLPLAAAVPKRLPPLRWALAALVAAAVLAIPLLGVLEKLVTAAAVVLDPRMTLITWGGDLRAFIPLPYFLNLPATWWAYPAVAALLGAAWLALRPLEAPVRRGLAAVVVLGIAGALWFRLRPYGFYFHFKLLAFTAPVLLALAVAGAARVRRHGPALVVVLALAWAVSLRAEVAETGYQLGRHHVELAQWAQRLPPGASVRLDMRPGEQLWAAYFLAARPVCSTAPLLDTDYPRAPIARAADYVVVQYDRPRPADALPVPLARNAFFTLYALDERTPELPGAEGCSRALISRIDRVTLP